MRPADAEGDDLLERILLAAGRKDRQRIARDRPIRARPLERRIYSAVAAHERYGLIEIAVGYLAVCNSAVPKLAFVAGTPPERQNDGKRDLSLAEIIADGFPKTAAVTSIVKCVVDELERQTEILSIRAQRRLFFCRALGQRRTRFRRCRKECRRLGIDDREIVILGRRRILGGGELHHFAFGNRRRRVRHDAENWQRSDVDEHLKGLPEQKITDEHARLVAPDHARRLAAAARRALVNDVVVKQRR